MPITREEFLSSTDESVSKAMRDIHEYLGDHRDTAYAQNEIADATMGLLSSEELFDPPELFLRSTNWARPRRSVFRRALERLVEVGAVEAKILNGELYFAYRSELHV